MDEPGRKSLTEWWQGLSGPWRVNGLLYLLTAIALVALLVEVVSGGDQAPKRVQVASRQNGRTTTTPRRPTTASPNTTTTTSAPGPSTTAAAGGPAGGGVAAAPQRGGGPTGPPALVVPPPPSGGGKTGLVCLNSINPACGPFSWQTPPGPNQPVTVSAVASPTNVSPGQPVTFSVTVSDPDHNVTPNCGSVDFGDGTSQPLNCNRPSNSACASAFGPWVTPPAAPGSGQFTFTHAYAAPRTYTAAFTFRTDEDRCPDPYGSGPATDTAVVTVS